MIHCNAPRSPIVGKEKQTAEDLTTKIITFAKDELKIDLSQYRDEMINAACRGQLEFTYHGPNAIFKTPWMFKYNCELRIINAMHYFLSISCEVLQD